MIYVGENAFIVFTYPAISRMSKTESMAVKYMPFLAPILQAQMISIADSKYISSKKRRPAMKYLFFSLLTASLSIGSNLLFISNIKVTGMAKPEDVDISESYVAISRVATG